jgi:hypothetical protein
MWRDYEPAPAGVKRRDFSASSAFRQKHEGRVVRRALMQPVARSLPIAWDSRPYLMAKAEGRLPAVAVTKAGKTKADPYHFSLPGAYSSIRSL